MNPIVEINKKIIKETSHLKQPSQGDKKLEIIHPYCGDFLEIFEKREINLILASPYYQWITSQNCFQNARNKMIEEGLITKKDEHTPMEIVLEFIIANSIHFFIGNRLVSGDKPFRRTVAPSKKRANGITMALRKLKSKFNLFRGIYCKYESKQHLLLALVEDILKDQEDSQRSVYSTGAIKNELLRELLTKRIIQGLYSLPKVGANIKPRTIAHIALNASEVFYIPMDITDATNLAEEIQHNAIEDEKFRHQLINDYLSKSLN